MPVPNELMPFFKRLVDKSRKAEVNWESTGRPDSFRVRFTDFSIAISQDGKKPVVRIELLNDDGEQTAVLAVDDRDEEWLGAVSLINSADRKVRKIGLTLRRAVEELGKEGPIGLGPPAS